MPLRLLAPIAASIIFEAVTHRRRLQTDLQQTARELETAYEELQPTNVFLESSLTSLCSGVVKVDRQMNVLVSNRRSEDPSGLRDDEVKRQSPLGLDIGCHIICTPYLTLKADAKVRCY